MSIFSLINRPSPDIWGSDTMPDIYKYVRNNQWGIRLLGWLYLVTFSLVIVGYVKFLNISSWYWVFFSLPMFIMLLNRLPRYIYQTKYRQLSREKHERFISAFWKNNDIPDVDVFLPYAGEDIGVYEIVIQKSREINYKNKHIYLLDDSNNPEVIRLAEQYNCIHLQRPNRGEYRKSGNLRYGYDHSSSPFVVVFDADFIPHPDFLNHTVPYMASSDSMGILQTPQYFEQTHHVHNRSFVEFGAANVVELFYRVEMPSRDRFGATMCVGTSALYRRAAIEAGGGPPRVWGTEDIRQGLLIQRYGYTVRYLPLVLSIGVCPENPQSYFSQHNRWCTGSIHMVFSHFLWKSKLKPFGKWIYVTNGLFYISEALSVILSFHLLVLLYFEGKELQIINVKWFIGYIILRYFVERVVKIYPKRLGTTIAGILQIYTYIYTLGELIRGKKPVWKPAGLKHTTIDKRFITTVRIAHIFWWTYAFSFLAVLITRTELLYNYNAYFLIFWVLTVLIRHGIFIYSMQSWIARKRREYISLRKDRDLYHNKIWYELQKISGPVFLSLLLLFSCYHITNNIIQHIL